MREISFDLDKYKGISGTLILEVPTYRNKLKLIKECNFKINDKGIVEINSDTIDSMIKLVDVAEPYFKKIDLKCDDIQVKSFAEMESYEEFHVLIQESALSLLNSGKLGKQKRPS